MSKGFRVVDWRDWYGDCTVQIFPDPYYTAGHPDVVDLEKAKDWGREVGTKTPYYSRHPRHPRRKQLSFEDD